MVDRWLVETELSEKWDFYTRANVGEVFPDPVAPLSFSYMQVGNEPGPAEKGFQRAYIRFGSHAPEEFPADACTFLGVTGGYCYLNASAMRLLGHRAPGMTAADIDYAFFGDAPGVPPFEPVDGDDRPDLTEKIAKTFEWIFSATDLPDVRAHEEMVNRLRRDRPDLRDLSDRELLDRNLDLFDTYFEDLFAEHIFISACATVPIGTISGVCEAVGRPEDTLKLLAGLGDVESAAPSMAMWDLGRLAADSEVLGAIFDAGISDLEDRLRAGTDLPEVAAFAQWMRDWAERSDDFNANLLVLGDFNLDRIGDPLFEAFLATGLWPPAELNAVPRTIFQTTDKPHLYDQIAWFSTPDGTTLLESLTYTGRAGGFNFLPHVYPGHSRTEVSWRISDHYLLWAQFAL